MDVLQYTAEKAIESFLPVLLELLASLLEADRKALASQQPGACKPVITVLAVPSPCFVSICPSWQRLCSTFPSRTGHLHFHPLLYRQRAKTLCEASTAGPRHHLLPLYTSSSTTW